MERLRQGVILTGDRNAMFLHRLQQRRLGARAGTVDFVGHQQLAEDRPFDEPEGAPPAIAFFEDFGAQYVGRHQVRRALDPFGVQAEHDRQRFDQLGLGQARHADQQHMAAGQQRDQGLLDHFALAEYYAFHAGPDPVQDFAELLQLGDGLVRRIAGHKICGVAGRWLRCRIDGQRQSPELARDKDGIAVFCHGSRTAGATE